MAPVPSLARNLSLPLHLEVVQVPEIVGKTPTVGVLETSRTQRWFRKRGAKKAEVPLNLEAIVYAVYNALDVHHEGLVEWRVVRLVFKMLREFLGEGANLKERRKLLAQLIDCVGVKNDKAGHVRRDHFVKLVLPFASRNPDFFEALPFRAAAQTVLRRLELGRVFNIGVVQKELDLVKPATPEVEAPVKDSKSVEAPRERQALPKPAEVTLRRPAEREAEQGPGLDAEPAAAPEAPFSPPERRRSSGLESPRAPSPDGERTRRSSVQHPGRQSHESPVSRPRAEEKDSPPKPCLSASPSAPVLLAASPVRLPSIMSRAPSAQPTPVPQPQASASGASRCATPERAPAWEARREGEVREVTRQLFSAEGSSRPSSRASSFKRVREPHQPSFGAGRPLARSRSKPVGRPFIC